MWLADSAPDVVGANLWLFLITCVTTAGAGWAGWLAYREHRNSKDNAAAAVDEALETQDRMIIQPIATERDDYRARWLAAIQGKPWESKDD